MDENFWFKPISEEMVLQKKKKIIDQRMFDRMCWYKTVFEEMIWQRNKFSTRNYLIKLLGGNLFLRK
jgi:hypothetical protein